MPLKVEKICFRYSDKSLWILKDVSLTIEKGERVGIIGPSGYGKSTLASIVAGYKKTISGRILLDGTEISKQGYHPIQMIHQHPELAVNPRWKMYQILNEAWQPDQALLTQMGIEASWMTRWPVELSGGELQRFCIARVLGPNTKYLICDEITTMLDVITQAQIWQLLMEISKERQLGMLIITHNMALANKVCDRVIDLQKINHIDEV